MIKNTIAKEQITTIKTQTDLIHLIESKGITLKKNGKGYVGLCPFHDDKTPSLSVNPTTNLWQCFGCGAAGDAIRFVELFDQVKFPEAINRLSLPSIKTGAVKKKISPQTPTAMLTRLLNRVIGFYHTAFTEDPRAREYLEQRGIRDNPLFADHKIGFANGSLLNVLADNGDTTRQLKELGILNDKNHEHFYGCVTFPLYDKDGNPKGMYGRRITESKESANHLYLPGPREGLFNREALKTHKDIILTESIIDSLTLMNAGIKNTIPCYGVNGLTPSHMDLFKAHRPEKILLCFDADDAGKTATQTVKTRLAQESMTAYPVTLPDGQDINDFFLLTANPAERFSELLLNADPTIKKAVKEEKEAIVTTGTGFILTTEHRHYDVRGITKGSTKLKATVKGVNEKRFYVDTVDFYSAKSRTGLIKGLCGLFCEQETVITRDLERLTDLAEHHQPNSEQLPEQHEITIKEKDQALSFLKNPNLFAEILKDFETIGYTGEEMNKLLCYIAAISRKMDTPLSVMIQSRSAAGKSSLQDAVLLLVPEEDSVKYTRLTDQSLFYMDKDSLVHKILAIEELDGMNGAIYSIRSIQSSKSITIAYTGKDPVTGELKTLTNTVNGPLMVFITTTKIEIDGETASRFVFIAIDESEDMTKKILEKQRESRTLDGMMNKLKADAIIQKHKNANRLLKPVHVLNPYARLLTFTSKSIRSRRDHTKYLNLIEAIAFLFQYQREIKTMAYEGKAIDYINVTLADVEKANTLANEVLGRSLDELTPPSRTLLALIRDMVMKTCDDQNKPPESYSFTRRDIREYSGWSDFQVKTHIRQLEELEYIYPSIGRKGKEYVYELLAVGEISDEKPFLIGLTDILRLKKKADELGIKENASLEG
ncbi:MAG: CHC2 zinc finger domain-containing protein [Desulfobacteraceae bacterium]|nr:CHC2 zinc finger domain-containing protein [Desulfobacteraceae bacterium]